jgi:hypothetical protein
VRLSGREGVTSSEVNGLLEKIVFQDNEAAIKVSAEDKGKLS